MGSEPTFARTYLIGTSFLALLMVITFAAGLVLLQREQNARISEQRLIRNEIVRGLEVVIVDQCREIEKLKKGERLDAERRYRELPRTLGLLNLEFTSELQRSAKEERDRDIARYAAKPGGCGEYPPPIRPRS